MAKTSHKKNEKKNNPIRQWIWVGVIAALAFLLYANTLRHEYTLDDDIYCLKNKYSQQGPSAWKNIFFKGSLHGFNGENDAQYRPFPLFNFAVEISMFKNDPHVHHFFNVLLYAMGCCVLYLLLVKLFREVHFTIPLAIALLFVTHPLHTDVVASIKSRDELWAFFFGISSFYLLMRYTESFQNKWLLLACTSFFFSTLSKENSLMFFFVVPLLLFFFTTLPVRKIITTSIPFVITAIAYIGLRSAILTNIAIKQEIIVMNNALMAAGSTSEMLASNFVILIKYLWLLLIPANLSWDYSYNSIPIMGWGNVKPLLSLLIHVGMAVFVILRFRKKDPIAFAILFYFFTLLLASNLIVKINATMAERFLFAPSLGFCIALAVIAARYLKPGAKWGVFHVSLLAVMVLYSMKVVSRNPVWKNNLSLFESGVKTNPGSARCWYALSSELKNEGDKATDPQQKQNYYSRSVEIASQGLKIYPDPDIYYNVGNTYYAMNKMEEARVNFIETIKRKPALTGAINNIGVIWFVRQNYDSAAVYFTRAIQVDSTFSDGFSNLGAVKQNKGLTNDAVVLYEKALRFNPNNQNARNNLSRIYTARGDTARANRLLKGGL